MDRATGRISQQQPATTKHQALSPVLISARRRKLYAVRRKRRYNLRLVKATWPYTVQEIAALLGLHKNAVLRWLNEGLQADRSRRPILIRGDELVRFLSARQQRRKHKCGLTEFYCFRCRTCRAAYLGIADILIVSPSRLRVKALCAACGTPVNKVQGTKSL